jgi:hypothetical protein
VLTTHAKSVAKGCVEEKGRASASIEVFGSVSARFRPRTPKPKPPRGQESTQTGKVDI